MSGTQRERRQPRRLHNNLLLLLAPCVGTESGGLARHCRQVTEVADSRHKIKVQMRPPDYKTMRHKSRQTSHTTRRLLRCDTTEWLLSGNDHEKQYAVIHFLFFYLSEWRKKTESKMQHTHRCMKTNKNVYTKNTFLGEEVPRKNKLKVASIPPSQEQNNILKKWK